MAGIGRVLGHKGSRERERGLMIAFGVDPSVRSRRGGSAYCWFVAPGSRIRGAASVGRRPQDRSLSWPEPSRSDGSVFVIGEVQPERWQQTFALIWHHRRHARA